MAVDTPSLAEPLADPRTPDIVLPVLIAVVVATIAAGLWLMDAPVVVVATSSALVAALLWLRAHIGLDPPQATDGRRKPGC